MMTKEQYIEFLISTPINYTCTHLADHISGISHDSITDFLKSQRLTAESVWKQAEILIRNIEESVFRKNRMRARLNSSTRITVAINIRLFVGLILSISSIVRETAITTRLIIAFLHQSTKRPRRTTIFSLC